MPDPENHPSPQLPSSAAQLEQTLGELGRNLSSSSLLLQEALAERLGLSATEIKCLDIIQRAEAEGPVTPSLLVERTGLTSGAITGLIDRLEAQRFVRREKSASDRRQVIVRSVPDRERELRAVYEPYTRAFRQMISHYEPNELLVVGRFVRESIELIERYAAQLREQGASREGEAPALLHDVSLPLADLSTATLEIARGASGLELGVCDASLLYRVATDGPLPELSLQRGNLRFQQKRAGMFDFKRRRLQLLLNPTIPWDVQVRGGMSQCRLDLRELWLTSLEISGGSSSLNIDLPVPREPVRLSVRGGVNQLNVRRPRGTAMAVVVHSGASGLALDSLQLGAVGGRTEWQSPDYAGSEARYELEVMGGANKLSVGFAQD
ncbi:MAG: MarR family transcriptional regulator [Myxococcota bacterium]